MNYTSEDKDEFGNPTPRGEICFRGSLISLIHHFKISINNINRTSCIYWIL
jgi:hypothetical protein